MVKNREVWNAAVKGVAKNHLIEQLKNNNEWVV